MPLFCVFSAEPLYASSYYSFSFWLGTYTLAPVLTGKLNGLFKCYCTKLPQIFFQEAICSSLEDYNEQIEKLKEEMNDATHGADNIRNDISALAQRYAVIDRDEECGVRSPDLRCFSI